MARHQVRGLERASLVGALLMAIAFLTVYIAILKSYDEPNTFNNPRVVAYVGVTAVGMFGIVALLLGANRSLAIPITSVFGLAGLLGLASIGILLIMVAVLVVPSVGARPADTVGEPLLGRHTGR